MSSTRDTSRQAALSVASQTNTMRQRVLDYLIAQGTTGATDEEMQRGLPMAPNTQRPRRNELAAKGAIKPSTLKRKTLSGRVAVVWVAVVAEEWEEVQGELF